MPELFYAVTATIPDTETVREYTDWLRQGHTDAVLEGGAISAQIITLDHDPEDEGTVRIETQYRFPSRDAFAHYEAGPAIPLREDGRARFADRITFQRRVGEITD